MEEAKTQTPQQQQADAWHIAMNVARWHLEQEKKALKREKDRMEAAKRGLSLAQLKDFRREGWKRRNGNLTTTLEELAAAHPPQQGK